MLEFNGTAIVLAISFIIFVILMNFLFYRPMKKVLDERNNYIADNKKDAEDKLAQSQELIDEKDKKISAAKKESSELLNKTTLETKEEFSKSVQDAKKSMQDSIEEVKNNLENEKSKAIDELKGDIANHSRTIISKILGKDVAVVNINNDIVEKALRGEL